MCRHKPFATLLLQNFSFYQGHEINLSNFARDPAIDQFVCRCVPFALRFVLFSQAKLWKLSIWSKYFYIPNYLTKNKPRISGGTHTKSLKYWSTPIAAGWGWKRHLIESGHNRDQEAFLQEQIMWCRLHVVKWLMGTRFSAISHQICTSLCVLISPQTLSRRSNKYLKKW